ncbi:lysozyme inhibitor LprI family protein [Flavobacterium sp. XS2P12]|uniref:lysozyme inhibitor LprI family protein n=1 Tax=Flavobacterium melibiosi TaxID=3398734 RepID=UPI003A83E4D4
MKKLIIFITLSFLFISSGCRNDKNTKNEVKTNFSSCQEVISYVKYRGYQSLQKEWGEAELGHIGLDNEGEFQIDIKWNKVRVNGKTVEFTFTKDETSNTPLTFVSAYCENSDSENLNSEYSTSNSNNNVRETDSQQVTSNTNSEPIEDDNDMSSNIKSAEELEVVDKKLNVVYKQVMAVLSETEKTALRLKQRKWIKYRDISCEEETKDMNGSLYNAFLNNCEKEKTEKRIEELNEILESKG